MGQGAKSPDSDPEVPLLLGLGRSLDRMELWLRQETFPFGCQGWSLDLMGFY